MIDFTKPMPKKRAASQRVTQWAEDQLPDDADDVTVMVTEIQCFEPGCAPLETVITLLGEQSLVVKIFKPVAEVVQADVVQAIQSLRAGVTQPEHLKVEETG